MRITIQYFVGCPHWMIANDRVHKVLTALSRHDVHVEHEVIQSPEEATRVGFHGSPTILVDGRDPYATGNEPVGMMCRVYNTEEGREGAPSESQLRTVLARNIES